MYPENIQKLVNYINDRKYHYSGNDDEAISPILDYPEACFQVLTGRGKGRVSHGFRIKLLKQLINDDNFLKKLIEKNYHTRATKKELNIFLPEIYKLKNIEHDKIAHQLKKYKNQTNSEIIESLLIPNHVKDFYLSLVIGEEMLDEFDKILKGDEVYDIPF